MGQGITQSEPMNYALAVTALQEIQERRRSFGAG